jgi:hypothetical protein
VGKFEFIEYGSLGKMQVSKIVLLFLIMVGWQSLSQSSKTSVYPENRNTYCITPAHAYNRLIDQEASGAFIHQRYLQLLSEINFTEFSGFVRNKKHQWGLLANQFNEGTYINRTSAYLHYAYFIRLREKTKLSLGSGLGIYNLSYDGSISGVTGSDTRPDLFLDAHFSRPRWYLYYTLKQLVSTDLKPLNAPVELKPYHEFRAAYSIEYSLGRKLYLQSHDLFYPDRSNLLGFGLVVDLLPAISAGITGYLSNSLLSQVKVRLGLLNNWETAACISYNLSLGNSNRSVYSNSLEFGVLISKKKAQDVYQELEEGVTPIE